MPDPKRPTRRKPKIEHSVSFRSRWMEGAAQGHGIYVLPVLTLIVGIILLNLAGIMSR